MKDSVDRWPSDICAAVGCGLTHAANMTGQARHHFLSMPEAIEVQALRGYPLTRREMSNTAH